ncbi:MAG TPA: hypothetical protein VKU82_13485, partial [Planctomycetaceae bacterium]|nr:hypothetical protein [Planctomycetaceae bacterium]
AEFMEWSPIDEVRLRIDGEALVAAARDFVDLPFDDSPTSRERLRICVAERLARIQDHIERDWPGYWDFELELIREQIGLDCHNPRLDE